MSLASRVFDGLRRRGAHRLLVGVTATSLLGSMFIAPRLAFADPPPAPPLAGSLDTSFAPGSSTPGIAHLQFPEPGGSTAFTNLVPDGNPIVDSSGMLYFLAHDTSGAAVNGGKDPYYVVALNSDGTLGTGFGGGAGYVRTSFGLDPATVAAIGPPRQNLGAMAFAQNGDLLVTGQDSPAPDSHLIKVAAYTDTGALDSGFGTGGETSVDIPNEYVTNHPSSMFVIPNGAYAGDILVSAWAGGGNTSASHGVFAVARFLPSGALDNTGWGNPNGYQTWEFTYQYDDYANAVTINPNNGDTIVVGQTGQNASAGGSTPEVGLAEFLPNGSLDQSFAGGGAIHYNSNDMLPTSVVVDSAGMLAVSGYTTDNTGGPGTALAMRWGTDGVVDSNFSGFGAMLAYFDSTSSGATTAASGNATLDSNGKLLLAGGSQNVTTSGPGIARINLVDNVPQNQLYDTSFGPGGTPGREVLPCTSGSQSFGVGIATQPGGRIIETASCNGEALVYGITPTTAAISGLVVTAQNNVVPAGHQQTPLANIPQSAVNPTLASVLGSPWRGGPWRGGPWRGGPWRGGPWRGGPWRGGPWRGGPLTVRNLPPIALSDAPLFPPDSWSQALVGTKYENLPSQSVTIQEVLALPAGQQGGTANLTMDQIDLSSTALRKLTTAGVLLGTTPLQNLPAPANGWQALLAGQPENTGSPQYDPAVTSPAELELSGDNLQAYYSTTPIQLVGANLVNSLITTTQLDQIQLDQTATGNVAVSSAPFAVSCTTGCASTLATAQDNSGGDQISQTATLGQVLALGPTAFPAGGQTLTDLIAGIIPPENLPVEQAAIGSITDAAPLPGTAGYPYPAATAPQEYATYQIDFDLACADAPGLSVMPSLPADFRYVPGTATMKVGATGQAVNVAPGGAISPTAPISCSGLTHVLITLGAEAPPVLGPAAPAGAVVTTNSAELGTGEGVGPSGLTIVDGTDKFPGAGKLTPATIDNPVTVPTDTLVLGHLEQPGSVNYYSFTAPTPGTTVNVTLSHLPADYDLVVYGQQNANLRTPDGTSPWRGGPWRGGPWRGGPWRGGGVPDNSAAPTSTGATTPPENVQDVPVNPPANMAVRGMSINRGSGDESVQFVTAPNDSSPFIIQISGFNGSFSPQPYALKVQATLPPAPLPCQARSYPGGGMAGVAPATPLPGGTQTLILVNEKRIGDIYGAAAEANVVSSLNTLAANPMVNGTVIPVESNPTVASDYAAWDASACSVPAANQIVTDINKVVDAARQGLSDLRSVVVVGNDEVMPFGRVPDLGPLGNEQGYDTASFNGKANATSAALRSGYLLSDDPYGDFSPTPWFSGQLFVPQVAIGRLVETPADITSQVNQFVSLGGRFTPNASFTAGLDFMTPVAQSVDASVRSELHSLGVDGRSTLAVPPTSTGGHLWNRSDAIAGFQSAANGFISLDTHHDQYRAESDAYFNTENATPAGDAPITPADLPSSLRDAVLFNMGCHTGLNIADVLVGNPTQVQRNAITDWAQVAAGRGGVLQANTGYGEGDSDVVAYSMRLTEYYAANLNGSMTLGQALLFAKQHYANAGAPSVYDAKAMEEAAFYGLPMYRLGPQGVSAPSTLPAPLPPPPANITAATTTSTFTDPLTSHTATNSDGGTYFTDGTQAPQVTPYEPVQPRAEVPLTAPAAGLLAHGALITSLTSADTIGFTGHFDIPVTDRTSFSPSPNPSQAAFPSALIGVNHTATPTGPQDSEVLVPAQYFTTPSGAVERLFSNIGSTIEWSNSQDFTAPTISTVDGSVNGSTVSFEVTTPNTNVARAVVMYLVQGGPAATAWTNVELTNLGNGSWGGIAAVPSGTQSVGSYFVQLVDTAGNVGVSSNKAFDYLANASQSSAQSFAISEAPGPDASGFFQKPTTVTVAPAAGHDGLSFSVSVDGGSPSEYTTPLTLTSAGFHRIDVVASDASTARAVIPIAAPATPITPSVSISSPSDGGIYAIHATVTPVFTCASPVGIASCTPSPATPDTSVPGPATFAVTAVDNNGTTATTTVHYTVDGNPPAVTITTKPRATTGSQTATFAFTATDPTFTAGQLSSVCTIDGAGVACPAPGSTATYSGLAAGTHSFVVTVTDPAGLTGSANYAWTISRVTNLVANSAVADVHLSPPALVTFLNLSAVLTDAGGAPIKGQTISFSAGTATICSAVTDGNGKAVCSGTSQLLSAILALGYKATYAGSSFYLPSSATGGLVRVLT